MHPEATFERRAEARRRPEADLQTAVDVPGSAVLEVVDVSEHGLCCRLGAPVAPGRTGTVRMTGAAGPTRLVGQVVRCEVAHLTADRVEYRAAWRLAAGWSAGR